MKAKLFCLVLTLQAAWMIGTIAVQEFRLNFSPTVLLETEPVDPRDLLRGDFVILNYKISTLPEDRLVPPLKKDTPAGTTIYVTLEPEGEFHRIASVTLDPPSGESRPVLKGQIAHTWGLGSLRAEYGLERYYVREGTGQPRGKLTARVSVPKSGLATIKQIYLDGRPYAEAMRDAAR